MKNNSLNKDCLEINLRVRKLVIDRKFPEAEKLARKNLTITKSPINYYSLALTLATYGFLQNKKSKKQQAKIYYKQIIKKFPNTMHAYLAEARIREESYKLKYAIPFYKKAFKLCPTSLNAIHISNAYKQTGKLKLFKKYHLIAENLK